MKRSVSESYILSEEQVRGAKTSVVCIAQNFIKEKLAIILPRLTIQVHVHLIKTLGVENFNITRNTSTGQNNIFFNPCIDNMIIMLDVLLQLIPDALIGDNVYQRYTVEGLGYECISLISDEYYIEHGKIYPKYNQENIRAIKELKNEDLNSILSSLSAGGNLKEGLEKIYNYLSKDKDLINQMLPKQEMKPSKDGNGKLQIESWHFFSNFLNVESNIRHSYTGREATAEELKVFFDFGLTMIRLLNIYKTKI